MNKIPLEQMEILQRIATLEANQKNIKERLDENLALINQVHRLATSVEKLASEIKSQGDKISDVIKTQDLQGEKIETLEMKPAKKWDSFVAKIIELAIAAVAGGIIARFYGANP